MIEFPRSRGAIPIPPTPLIGREDALAAVLDLLGDPQIRFVTLIGPGGVGKTRLALELAITLEDAFADGSCFVPLEVVADSDLVPAAIAQGLGVGAFGGRSLLDALLDAARRREQLLVLDNFEHLLASAPIVAELLAAGPGLKILVTSREALRLRGEHEVIVPPLALPDEVERQRSKAERESARRQDGETARAWRADASVARLSASPAVMLFVQRARAARSDFSLNDQNAADVAAICDRLDGLPLAIELAAARVSHLSPGAIVDRIDRQRSARLSLLTGGPRDAPARLQTIRDAIAWSHELLDDDERVTFRRLAVFAGGFGIDAAAVVCETDDLDALDGIRSLLAKSLIRDDGDCAGEPRFGMLETIRVFGLERLTASAEAADVRQRHADWCLAFAEHAAKAKGPDGALWLQRLERDYANLRAGLTWLMEQGAAPQLVRLAGALWPFWEDHAHYREGRRWLEAALARESETPPADRLRALIGAGTMAWYEGGNAQATRWHKQALTLARESGDRLAEATALNNLGAQALDLGEDDRAALSFEASLAVARAAAQPRAAMIALHNLAQIARLGRESALAAPRIEEALALAREIGDAAMMSSGLTALGHTMLDMGDPRRAAPLFGESLDLAQDRGNLGDLIDAWEGLARLGAETGDFQEAAQLFGATAALRDAIGVPCSPSDIAYFEPTMRRLRAALGGDGFAAAMAAGRDLSRQDAVAKAISLATGAAPPSPPEPAGRVILAGPEAGEWASGAACLTHREREVLRLVADGLSNKEIGAELAISAQTVTKHVGNVLRKLGVPSRTAAATLATRRGLIPG
jgi:predicted ATPase/DNA-binding CsgD family transcriptional regulator